MDREVVFSYTTPTDAAAHNLRVAEATVDGQARAGIT